MNKYRVKCSKLRFNSTTGKLQRDVILNRVYFDLEMSNRVYNFLQKYHPNLRTELIAL